MQERWRETAFTILVGGPSLKNHRCANFIQLIFGEVKMFKGISKVVTLSILCAALLLSVMVCSDSSFAAGTGDKGPQLEWSLDFHLVIPALEIAERGTQAKADALGPLLEKIKAEGMTSELLPLRTGDNGPAYLLRVSSRAAWTTSGASSMQSLARNSAFLAVSRR